MSKPDSFDLDALVNKMKSAASPLRTVLRELYEKYLPLREGKVADYIPELAKADPDSFGISVVTKDGQVFSAATSNSSSRSSRFPSVRIRLGAGDARTRSRVVESRRRADGRGV